MNIRRGCTILGLSLFLAIFANAQYFDPDHIQDLRFRLLISYFQEYRTFDMSIAPAQTTAPESLPTRLSSPVVGLSGFLLQYNNASVYLAGSFTEKDNPIADPDAKALKFIWQRDAFSSSGAMIRGNGKRLNSTFRSCSKMFAPTIPAFTGKRRWFEIFFVAREMVP